MATYDSFEDLPVWQQAKKLACQVYDATLKDKLSKDYALKNQIQRSAISVSSNIAEGFERGSKQEFIQFLYIAKGSCGELRSHLVIAKDICYINNHQFEKLSCSAAEVSRQIAGFIEYLKKTTLKGQKFKNQRGT